MAKKVKSKEETCSDKHCPIHGGLKLRGRTFEGTVISDKMHRTVTVKWGWLKYIPKYERYEKRSTKISAHNPPCIGARAGDKVKIKECHPLSKTKKFVVIEKVK